MATELAKAYVQILPSAQGMKANLEKVLDNEMPTGDSHGEKVGQGLVSGIKKVIVAAGLGKIIKDAFSEGAALEQSKGGVETLFKNNADIVKRNAEQAYKTAGLSANEYMETVTSFSATLLQGLGGDTVKAAEIADRAIVAMSDNSNKFGTNMQSVMNAYMGFSKQNYTMLDNLKLGYGGTQSEMARLINDSGVLGNAIEVTAETVKDVPFDKVIEAIGVIQDNLGVTGTTAKEAATTFSGSMASMKASAKNLLGALASGEGVKDATEQFISSAEVFLKDNALPMLSRLINASGELLGTAIKNLPQFIWDTIQGLSFEGAAGLLATTFGVLFLKDLKSYLGTKAGPHWSAIRGTISDKLGENAEGVGSTLGSKICAGVVAFMAGWQIGSWIYDKWGTQINENFLYPLYDTITGAKSDEELDAQNDILADQAWSKTYYGNDWEYSVKKVATARDQKMISDAQKAGLPTDITQAKVNSLVYQNTLSSIGLSDSKKWGSDLSASFAHGISDNIGVVVGAATGLASSVKSVIGFSEPETGPLSDFHTYAPDMMQLFAQGISDNRKLVEDEVNAMMSSVKDSMTEPVEFAGGQAMQTTQNGSKVITLRLADDAGRIIAEGTVSDIDLLQGQAVELTDRRLA